MAAQATRRKVVALVADLAERVAELEKTVATLRAPARPQAPKK